MVGIAGLVLCLLNFGLHPLSAIAAGRVDIKLKKEALVPARTFTLGDIAELGPNSISMCEEIRSLVVGITPRPGQLAMITRFEVTARLEKEFPGLGKRLIWEGPTAVQVRGIGLRLDAKALQGSAEKALNEWLLQKYKEVSVQVLGRKPSVVVPGGEVSFQPKLSATASLKKRMPVWVDVFVDGQHFQTIPVWFAVSVKAPVLVAKDAMEHRHELSTDDLAEAVVDIAALRGDPLEKSSLAGKRLVRRLAAGEVVTAADVEPVPAVNRGELITVYASHGSVSLAAKGIALADGEVFQRIEVKNPGSGESYWAKVIGKNLARVD